MSERPPLPATDDPFELLGVDAEQLDAKTIKRAYVRLIKVYRPESAPIEFQRIHQAYETARAVFESGGVWHGTVHRTSHITAAGPSVPQQEATREGSVPSLDVPVAPSLHDELTEALLRGDIEAAGARIEAPDFVRMAIANEQLEVEALRVICAIAWRDLDWAERLYRSYAGSAADGSRASYLHGLYSEIRTIAEPWRHIASATGCPAPLRTFVELAGLVDFEAEERLLSELASDFGDDPAAYRPVLDATVNADGVAAHVYSVLSEASGSEPPLLSLDDESQYALHVRLRELDRALAPGLFAGIRSSLKYIGALLFVMFVGAQLGSWALLGAVAIMIGVGIWLTIKETHGRYFRKVRPVLCDVTCETGAGPGALREWIARDASGRGLGEHEQHVRDDVGLGMFSALARIHLDSQPDG